MSWFVTRYSGIVVSDGGVAEWFKAHASHHVHNTPFTLLMSVRNFFDMMVQISILHGAGCTWNVYPAPKRRGGGAV